MSASSRMRLDSRDSILICPSVTCYDDVSLLRRPAYRHRNVAVLKLSTVYRIPKYCLRIIAHTCNKFQKCDALFRGATTAAKSKNDAVTCSFLYRVSVDLCLKQRYSIVIQKTKSLDYSQGRLILSAGWEKIALD